MIEVGQATATDRQGLEEPRAGDMVHEATAYAGHKMGWNTPAETITAIRQGDLQAYSYFRYALAREFSLALGRLNNTIRESYLFFEDNTDSLPGEPLQLGLLVTRKTAALQSLIDIIGGAVLEETKACLGQNPELTVRFHVELLDPEAVASKTGLAALMGSTNHPPLRVWPFPA